MAIQSSFDEATKGIENIYIFCFDIIDVKVKINASRLIYSKTAATGF